MQNGRWPEANYLHSIGQPRDDKNGDHTSVIKQHCHHDADCSPAVLVRACAPTSNPERDQRYPGHSTNYDTNCCVEPRSEHNG